MTAPAQLIEEVFRREGPRVLAGLIRRVGGDFELAEDALQDACSRALEAWAAGGVPERPAAWLTTVARRRAADLVRRRRAAMGELDELPAPEPEEPEPDPAEVSGLADDRLRLLFTCCHPALAREAQVALALRTLGGLTTREIARAYVEPEATTAQRLVRAKRKIRAARIPYEIPRPEDLPERTEVVLAVLYLIFNEGYAATDEPGLVRPDLCVEAIRLARLVVELLPEYAEAHGLLALMRLHDARRAGRVGSDGALTPLEEQDRSRWDAAAIAEGLAILDGALALGRSGPYQIQAAIAALHARAARAADTDWPQIAALYRALLARQPSDVVALNAAVAVAMAEGPEAGLRGIDEIAARGELDGYHLLHAARAELLRRAGRPGDARAAYARALELVTSPAERTYLERRLASL